MLVCKSLYITFLAAEIKHEATLCKSIVSLLYVKKKRIYFKYFCITQQNSTSYRNSKQNYPHRVIVNL